MKFSNGHWLMKEGYMAFSPAEVYQADCTPKEVHLLVPTHKIEDRGATLNSINLTLKIWSPLPGIIGVKAFHHFGHIKEEPYFELYRDIDHQMKVCDEEKKIRIESGNAELIINKQDFSMTYLSGGKKKCSSRKGDLSYIKTEWRGQAYVKNSNKDAYMRQQLSLGVGELIYGLGERFTAFTKNGQSVDIWNEDGGTSTEQSYKNIPFYISNSGYGIFVNHPEKVSFEVASEEVTKVGFSVQGESLEYFFIGGTDMKEVLRKYMELTGRPALPAPWTFGLWLSTSFTTNYDEDTVMSFLDGMRDREIPLKVFHFDCFWMKAFHWSDFTWDSRVFRNPRALLEKIKARGMKVCVWINPYIAQESKLFLEGAEKGYFLKSLDGAVWQWDMWQSGMAIVDFTNPSACKWFQDRLEVLLDMGVDCFKTDFGERIPEDCTYYSGMDPHKMHNYYSYLYNKIVFELLERKKGKENAVLFARSATVGGQKFPVHWGGDCWSDYPSMEESLRGGLSLQLSGFGFWSHDIGGFESTSTPDVYKRWAAFGLLSSHSRLHGSTSYRVPWLYDEEAVDVVRFFTKLKLRLMPYLFKTAVQAHVEGIPMMRAMVLEFIEDKMCHYLDKQYMLGDSFLVAPIFNEDSVGEFYLPKGRWTNYFSGEEIDGGAWYTDTFTYLEIPLFVRPGSMIPVGANDTDPEYNFANEVSIKIYQLEIGKKVSTNIHRRDGSIEATFRAERFNDKIEIQTDTDKPYTVELINQRVKKTVGGTYTIDGHNSVITQGKNKIICYV